MVLADILRKKTITKKIRTMGHAKLLLQNHWKKLKEKIQV